MTQTTSTQPGATIPIDRLTRRKLAMGVAPLVVCADGSVRIALPGEESQAGTASAHVATPAIGGALLRVQRLIASSTNFTASVESVFEELSASLGEPVAVWPGVWLVRLPSATRRRALRATLGGRYPENDAAHVSEATHTDPANIDTRSSNASENGDRAAQPKDAFALGVEAGMLVGDSFFGSEQFRRVCDLQGVDYAATCASLKIEFEREAKLSPESPSPVHDTAIVDTVGADTTPESIDAVARMLVWMCEDAAQLDMSRRELGTLSTQLGESYEELSLLYRFSTGMTFDRPSADLIRETISDLHQVAGLSWLALQVGNEKRLGELRGSVFSHGELRCDPQTLVEIGKRLVPAATSGDAPVIGRVIIIDDTSQVGPHLEPAIQELCGPDGLAALGQSVLLVPMMHDDRVIGVLVGGDKIDGSAIGSVDSKLCSSLATSLAMFLENRMLFDDSQAMFLGTLHALTASIDAKDSYTRGHSERVAILSRRIAEAAGYDKSTCERVYLAGLVHDVGKIGVPEAVLCKPGRLTGEEFDLVKQHPAIGARIIADIPQMSDLVPGVLYHHERFDGKGYPEGLAGRDIPLFGRIIGLADAFDAMSSNRTYRSSLDHQAVLEEIRRCAGVQFDPDLAHAFVDMDFTEFFQIIRSHKAQVAITQCKQSSINFDYDPEENMNTRPSS